MHRLLSTNGQYKYSMYKKSNPEPELEGPSYQPSDIDLSMPNVTKSVLASSPKSLLGNYTIGGFDASIPNDTWAASADKVQDSNPNFKIPGVAPRVRGISLGYRF